MRRSEKHSMKEEYKGSLLAKVTGITLASSLLMGIVILFIGMTLYSIALVDQYITESFCLARSTSVVIDNFPETERITDQIMDAYHSMTDEERIDFRSEKYREKFSFIEQDEGWQQLRSILGTMRKSSDVQYLYMGVYDTETHKLVYICDPDKNPQTLCPPGEWENPDKGELEKFLSWDGKGQLYDIGRSTRHGYMCTSGYPLKNSNGKVFAFIMADVTLFGVVKGVGLLAIQYFIALVIILYLIGYYLRKKLTKTLVDPINSISYAAQDYVRDRNAGITATDHFDKLEVHTGDEIEHLTMIMADMEHNIAAYEQALSKAVADREREHTEMDLASRIQMNMLPMTFPAFPDRDEFDIYASMNPAREVGGDFYDFFFIDEDHLCMIIADVSGKGIPAALFMMASMIIVGNTAMTAKGSDPGAMLTAANKIINMHNNEDMFLTVWLGILEISTGKLSTANAGHEYPVVRHAGGPFELIKDPHGLVLGIMEDTKYEQYQIQLEPGSKIFVYTDGLPEATNEDNELFGTDRMIEALNKDPDAVPEEILKGTKHAVDLFVGKTPQFDDLTMLCLEYKGGHKSSRGEKLKKKPLSYPSKWTFKDKIHWH